MSAFIFAYFDTPHTLEDTAGWSAGSHSADSLLHKVTLALQYLHVHPGIPHDLPHLAPN
ncbi:hypothetical protein BU16DRAFT_524613 [Lophium mytilinum]|uniref:Uncharacterized protein n=1 Tax=Lophium mytilinum TaxID=390894 RepID=A0A6A6R3L7_9PEZI|nr:hypothetical protein BU16DRAFT_524613 [Lophium mytilinum]